MTERLYPSHKVTISTEAMNENLGMNLFGFAIQPPIRDADTTAINTFGSRDTNIHVTGQEATATTGWVESRLLSELLYPYAGENPQVPTDIVSQFEALCDPLGTAVTQVVFLEQRGNGAEM